MTQDSIPSREVDSVEIFRAVARIALRQADELPVEDLEQFAEGREVLRELVRYKSKADA